jgi:hypothetical protein
MKHDYEERRQNRIEYAQKKAAKKKQLADTLAAHAHEMASYIPMGQPILVGHHSEKADRRYRQRISDTYGKSVQAGRQAAYYDQKAETIAGNTAISSDDPQALEKLRKKLAAIEAAQAYMKAANKCIRKNDKAGFLALPHSTEGFWTKLTTPDYMKCTGFPAYVFQNNSAEIRRVKKRIGELEALGHRKTSDEVINGIRLIENVEANRVQIVFPSIPSDAVRTRLKRHGFRWCRSECAWQRQLNPGAVRLAKELLKDVKEFAG